MRSTPRPKRRQFPFMAVAFMVVAVVGVFVWRSYRPGSEPGEADVSPDRTEPVKSAERAEAVEEALAPPVSTTEATIEETVAPPAITAVEPGPEEKPSEPDRSGYTPPAEITAVASKLTEVKRTAYPPVTLRGYGKLGGEMIRYMAPNAATASLITIDCEDARRAGVVHAKYQSDLRLLGGVHDTLLKTGETELAVNHVRAQGLSMSVSAGPKVYLLSASDAGAMAGLIAHSDITSKPGATLIPQQEVPMLLDAWDKHGFRFYYRPWELPQGATRTSYNPLKEFDFASGLGKLGVIFWAETNLSDTAEGINNDLWWEWGARAARRRGLPTVINVSSTASTWLLNRYRGQTMQKMPQYCGAFHSIASPYLGGTGVLSWCAEEAKDIELSMLQRIVKHYAGQENVIDFLEPHGELKHGDYDIFLEYGPVADKSYRTFLKQKYKTPGRVSTRWYGRAGGISSWNKIRVPEVASFLGWGSDALDLTGTWRVVYEKDQHPAPSEWLAPGFDDTAAPEVTAPGHDRTMFLPKRPAVYRRRFDVPAAWRRKHDRVWLYVWDLVTKHDEVVIASLNGTRVGSDKVKHAQPHWCAFEVSGALKAGENFLAIRLPEGYLAYRTYLSPHAPKQYPDLGEGLNAQWVDFADWRRWTRLEMARRGMEMIRAVDPDRGIICMAPGGYTAGIKRLCERYGARFHNTGYMGAWWAELSPMIMRGSDLPFSLEPGGPARNLTEFKKMMGLYATEGIHAIHYFIHLGNIMWEPEIRRHFEENLPVIGLIGKCHLPKAGVAALFSSRVENLTQYPWGKDPNTNLGSGYWNWKFHEYVLDEYQFDGLTGLDFEDGNADAYPVIFDTNTSILDEDVLNRIEKWVRSGGTFVTFVQTGRHTPTKRDAWPISRLTGYEVTHIDPHDAEGRATMRTVSLTPGQDVLPAGNWKPTPANGLSMKKVAPECRDFLTWEDGSIAAGVRPLGKGRIVHLGMKFCHNRMYWDGTEHLKRLLKDLLNWAKVKSLPARADGVLMRHYVSNSGLYDVWVMWNQNEKGPAMTDLVFGESVDPAFCIEVKTGRSHDVVRAEGSARLAGLHFDALETKAFITPRRDLASAAHAWFDLQRKWWRGTEKPTGKPLKEFKPRNALDLTEDWACKPLAEGDDADALVGADVDDTGWKRMGLGVWAVPEELTTRHALFRKRFTVPAEWRDGRTALWIRSWFYYTVQGRMRVWLDGKLIKDGHPPDSGVTDLDVGAMVRAGNEHLLAVEVIGDSVLPGPRGNSWLSFIPAPRSKMDLAGKWEPTKDALHYEVPVELPGEWDALMARRPVNVPRAMAGGSTYLYMDTGPDIIGVLVNGHWVRRHHHKLGRITHLDITQWIEFGRDNEVEIVKWDGSGRSDVKEIALWFYDSASHP